MTAPIDVDEVAVLIPCTACGATSGFWCANPNGSRAPWLHHARRGPVMQIRNQGRTSETDTAAGPSSPTSLEFGVDFEVFDSGWHREHRGGFDTRQDRDTHVRDLKLRHPSDRIRDFVPIKRRVGAWGPDQ